MRQQVTFRAVMYTKVLMACLCNDHSSVLLRGRNSKCHLSQKPVQLCDNRDSHLQHRNAQATCLKRREQRARVKCTEYVGVSMYPDVCLSISWPYVCLLLLQMRPGLNLDVLSLRSKKFCCRAASSSPTTPAASATATPGSLRRREMSHAHAQGHMAPILR